MLVGELSCEENVVNLYADKSFLKFTVYTPLVLPMCDSTSVLRIGCRCSKVLFPLKYRDGHSDYHLVNKMLVRDEYVNNGSWSETTINS